MPLPPRTLYASLLSTAIAERLRRPGRLGSVHSVYRGALNICSDIGLLTIAWRSSGGLPNGILVSEDAEFTTCVIVGQPVTVDERGLRLPKLNIDLRHAARWSPRLEPGQAPLPAYADLAPLLRTVPDLGGFSGVLSGRMPPPPSIIGLAQALHGGTDQDLVASCSALVGLGDGLTPSGDDLLVGASAALRRAGDERAARLATAAAEMAPGHTTDIALMFHTCAARGDYSQRLHALLERLADGPRHADVEVMLDWGASSGADCLLGVVVASDPAFATWPDGYSRPVLDGAVARGGLGVQGAEAPVYPQPD